MGPFLKYLFCDVTISHIIYLSMEISDHADPTNAGDPAKLVDLYSLVYGIANDYHLKAV